MVAQPAPSPAPAEREALLQRALDASALERRRVAQHLHDGVVQDLAGVSYARRRRPTGSSEPAASARGGGARRCRLDSASAARAQGLLIGIYPPSLQRSGLEAAVSDLLAPLSARGIAVQAEIGDDLALTPETEELIFRGAQEALRNVAKHADPTQVAVSVRRSNGSVVLAVRDDGRGFDPAAARRRQARAWACACSRISWRSASGRLEVHSGAGRGTLVTMELAAR